MIKQKNLAILFTLFYFFTPNFAQAETNNCDQSEIFQKRLVKSVKKLENRLQKYEVDSPPSIALKQQIAQTKKRFDQYGKLKLVCGNEGLPHLYVNHTKEFILPGLLFLYITGWIGWVGRKYLRKVSETSNSTEKEIILDIPLALYTLPSGFLWPLYAVQELKSGDLVAEDITITSSPK